MIKKIFKKKYCRGFTRTQNLTSNSIRDKKFQSNFISVIKSKHNFVCGFTLIEMLAYIAVLSIILVLIVTSLSSLITSENRVNIEKNIETSASTALERMTRDIRDAKSIDTAGSTFGSNSSVLSLNTTDVGGNPKTEAFYLDNNILKISENGTETGALTFSSSRVTKLVFKSLDSGNSSAIQIKITIESGIGQYLKSETFYSTVILRGSY
ncbi:MAG: prepilin-type N-terminal cleavage/methylation domain-containing protein [Parcubacteria group bacterium]|nr:prepilin-type N-terminal cleavage/methylation domain-containing protein [Parcubacteria group bacterium]